MKLELDLHWDSEAALSRYYELRNEICDHEVLSTPQLGQHQRRQTYANWDYTLIESLRVAREKLSQPDLEKAFAEIDQLVREHARPRLRLVM